MATFGPSRQMEHRDFRVPWGGAMLNFMVLMDLIHLSLTSEWTPNVGTHHQSVGIYGIIKEKFTLGTSNP